MSVFQASFHRRNILSRSLKIILRTYSIGVEKSTDKKGKVLSTSKEVEVPVETDVNKLIKYVCGTNLFVENGSNVEIKPDSEYPDWLWTLHTGKPKELHELDPNTMEYWKLVRKLGYEEEKYLLSLRQDKRDHK